MKMYGEESANASFDSQETNKHRPELHAKKDGDDHTYGREEINEGAGPSFEIHFNTVCKFE